MPKKSYLRQFLFRLRTTIERQLIITIATLPLLAYWGLPISSLTIAGNIIFAPMLSILLLGSSILFFTELFAIPNIYLAHAVQHCIGWYLHALSYGNSAYVASVQSPTIPTICACWLMLIALIHNKMVARSPYKIILYSAFGISLVWYLQRPAEKQLDYYTIAHDAHSVTIIRTPKNIVLIDDGSLGTRATSAQFIEYTLLPELRKKEGTDHINHWISLRYTCWTFDALITACTCAKIEHMYLPAWRAKLPSFTFRRYCALRSLSRTKNISLHIIGTKRCSITTDQYQCIIEPDEQSLTYHDAQIQAMHVTIDTSAAQKVIYPDTVRKMGQLRLSEPVPHQDHAQLTVNNTDHTNSLAHAPNATPQ